MRRYGKWMRDEAEERIGHLYPKVKISGVEATVIAWIWARTVTCPNPACAGTMPLVTVVLARQEERQRALRHSDPRRKEESASRSAAQTAFLVMARLVAAGAVCLLCDTPVPLNYIRDEGKVGRMGAQLMAIAAEGTRQRYYVAPTEEHEKAADVPRPDDVPEEELAKHPRQSVHRELRAAHSLPISSLTAS